MTVVAANAWLCCVLFVCRSRRWPVALIAFLLLPASAQSLRTFCGARVLCRSRLACFVGSPSVLPALVSRRGAIADATFACPPPPRPAQIRTVSFLSPRPVAPWASPHVLHVACVCVSHHVPTFLALYVDFVELFAFQSFVLHLLSCHRLGARVRMYASQKTSKCTRSCVLLRPASLRVSVCFHVCLIACFFLVHMVDFTSFFHVSSNFFFVLDEVHMRFEFCFLFTTFRLFTCLSLLLLHLLSCFSLLCFILPPHSITRPLNHATHPSACTPSAQPP